MVTEPEMPRGPKDVAHIVAEEIDTMTAVFSDIGHEYDAATRTLVSTFTCDGELYMLTVCECPAEVRAELGY